MTTALRSRPLPSCAAHGAPQLDADRMWHEIVDALTRRELVGAGLAALALAACGGAADDATTPTSPSTWNFVDDRGATISLSTQPRNVVVYEDFLPTMSERGLRPVGVLAATELTDNAYIAATAERLGIDLGSIAAVSTSYGDVNLELLASLEPDLIVSYYNLLSEDAYGFGPDSQPLAEEMAPFALLYIQSPVPVGAARADQLAVSLGGSASVEAERERYEAAFARLVAIAADRSGLSVVVTVPSPESAFICGADIYPLTALLGTAGFTTVDGVPGTWAYSWETFPEEAASDVMLLAVSPASSMQFETLDQVADEHPTFSLHPAVAAGQAAAIYPNNLPPHWYSIAATVETLADYLETTHRL